MKKLLAVFAVVLPVVAAVSVSAWTQPCPAAAAPTPAPSVSELGALIPDLASDDLGKRTSAMKAVEAMAMNAARPGAEAERAEVAKAMAAKLGADTPQLARVWLLRQLQLMGRAEVVPQVAALLDDKDALVRESARRAIAWNPSAEAAAALRTALGKATAADWRVAIINALGARKDAASASVIAKFAGDADKSVALAAIAALGRIGGTEAAKTLAAALASASQDIRPQVWDAYLLAADEFVRQGSKEAAAKIYQEAYAPAMPKTIRIAGLRGLVAATGEKALPIIAEILSGSDTSMQGIALSVVQEVPGPETTKALVALAPKLPPAGQAALITELGRRADPIAKPTVLDAAKSKEDNVRWAAVRALGILGAAADVPLLAQIAAAAQGPEADAARNSLTQLKGQDINTALLAEVAKPEAKIRVEAIRALAARKATDATAAMAKATADTEPEVRLAAIAGLESVGDEKSLPLVISLLLKSQKDDERQAAEKTILAICGRAADREACLPPVIQALTGAPTPARASLFKALARVGGEKAIVPVRAAVKDADPAVKEAAIRALAEWSDAAAAADLLSIAKAETNATLQVVALRGYLRIARMPDRPAAEKVKMCEEALAVAKRPEEKRDALGVLSEVNQQQALVLVAPLLDDPKVRDEAAQAATRIAKSLGSNLPPETKEMMAKILEFSKNDRVKKDAQGILGRIKK